MTYSIDMRRKLGLCVALLLILVAAGPVCLLMTPSVAFAEPGTQDCGGPASDGPMIDCPHGEARVLLQATQESHQGLPDVVCETALPIGSSTAQSVALLVTVADQTPTSLNHIPLRL